MSSRQAGLFSLSCMLPLLRLILRVVFRLLYNEMAFTYDLVSWGVSLGQWRSWQRAALPYLRGRRVLEIAHGTGNMLLDLVALGFEPVGLDISRAMGQIARRKLGRRRFTLPLVRGQAQTLPFPNGSFPSILSTFPTEFIMQPAVIAEFHRVLQPGGTVVFVPTADITGLTLSDRFARWLFRVTGQSAGDWFAHFKTAYADAGFSARVERVRLPRRCVLLFGQEGPGLSGSARDAAHLVCSITQFGSTRSINAGVASGIAMHTWVRQHAFPDAGDDYGPTREDLAR